MSINKGIYDFLTTDDNLDYVIELSNELDEFQKDMHRLFWTKYNQIMTLKLSQSEFEKNWRFRPYNLRQLLKDWVGTSLTQKIDDPTRIAMSLNFLQESREANFRLSYTTNWGKRSSEVRYESASVLKFKATLAGYKINIPSDWSYMWGFSKWRIHDTDFLKNFYKDPDGFCEQIVSYNWEMFLDLRPLMETINQEVASIKK